jgi:hypothetical protein
VFRGSLAKRKQSVHPPLIWTPERANSPS